MLLNASTTFNNRWRQARSSWSENTNALSSSVRQVISKLFGVMESKMAKGTLFLNRSCSLCLDATNDLNIRWHFCDWVASLQRKLRRFFVLRLLSIACSLGVNFGSKMLGEIRLSLRYCGVMANGSLSRFAYPYFLKLGLLDYLRSLCAGLYWYLATC